VKIALITDGISPFVVGGMQQHSASMGVELVKAGHSVDLFHFVLKGQEIPTTIEINNFYFKSNKGFNNVFCCFFPISFKFPGHYLWNSYKYSKWVYKHISLQKDEYEFIYSKGFTAWKLLINRNKISENIKIGIKFHGYEMFQYAPNFKIKLQYFMLRPFVKMINRKADFIFSYGSKITDIILDLGVDSSKIIELPSAIDESWINENKLNVNQSIKYLFVGRFERRKGIEEINNTILNLSQSDENFEFHFIGSIPKANRIKSEKIKIIYHGLIKDEEKKKLIYDKCDVLLCPSYSEGMPNVILEAMSRGLIIIATDVGAVSLMVSTENGFLLNSCNENLIGKTINRINATEKKLLRQMKYCSVKKVKNNFVWSKVGNLLNYKIRNKLNLL